MSQPPASTKSWRHDRRKTSERGYGWAWQQARLVFLKDNPLCVKCTPRAVAATVVDHKVPHRGDEALFWDRTNWQPLCRRHHDGDKQVVERSGRQPQAIGLDGFATGGESVSQEKTGS